MTKEEKAQQYFDKAEKAYQRGDYTAARNHLEKTIELKPNFAEAYGNLAILLAEHFQEYEKAKKYYEKAIELKPNWAGAHFNFANLLWQHFKEYEKAKQYYEKTIELKPDLAEAYGNLAILLSQEFDDNAKAKQYFAKYRELTKTSEKQFTEQYGQNIKAIESVSIENYFAINTMRLENLKDKKEIYFLGENGDGKTILLQAIMLAFQQNYIKDYADKVLVGEALECLSDNSQLTLKAKDSQNREYSFLELNFAQNLFAYGINRSRRYEELSDQYGFMTLFSNKIRLNNPEEWLQKLDYYESRKDYKSPFPLQKAIEILKSILDSNIEKIDVTPDGVTFFERGTPLEFHQLSDGYKSVLIWVSDLIVKLARSQPAAQSSADFEGVVLIDEIDLHLHPKWAYSIVSKLRNWFPKIQWLITTHSPTVTLGASPDAVFYKLYKEDGKIQLTGPVEKLNMTANSLYTSLLWRLESFTTKDIEPDKISSDDYIFQKIHEQIAKRIQSTPNLVDEDITKMIEDELDQIDNQ